SATAMNVGSWLWAIIIIFHGYMTNMNLATVTCFITIVVRARRTTMRRKWTTLLAVLIASTILVATAYAGGWAVVTVRDLPEYAVAGKPLRLEFLVRGAGISPAAGLKPKVAAMSATGQVNIKAVETKKEGEYTATLVIP